MSPALAPGSPSPAGPLPRLRWGAWLLAAVGLALSGAGLAVDPQRFAFSYLFAFAVCWTLVVGCLFFVALHHATAMVWSVVVRRAAEAFAGQAWFLALAFLPLLAFVLLPDTFGLYPWADPQRVAAEPTLAGRTPYLGWGFFTLRGLLFVGLWAVAGAWFVGRSLAQDRGQAGDEATLQLRRFARPFLVLFAVSVTFAGFDWLMSLDPGWFSTMFGVYLFAGMFVSALAVITLTVLGLRAAGRLTPAQLGTPPLGTLGLLIFAISCFWAYIAFSQFMLIWYGNLPEETAYLQQRLHDDWLAFSIALPVLRFGLPFTLLLARVAKLQPVVLVGVSLLVLLGQLWDLWWLVMPTLHPGSPAPGWIEFGPLLALSGGLGGLLARFFARHPAVAVGDPLLARSLQQRLG